MTHHIAHSIIRGGWQLAPGHLVGQSIDDALSPILDSIDAGFRVFDCADIYPGVENLLGQARVLAAEGGVNIRVHTKCVPDRDALATVGLPEIERIVDQSLLRLQCDSIELVQFHWWDYNVPRYLDALDALSRLKKAGKIQAIGLTNFDACRLQEILDAGIDVHSIQLQYSLVDKRSEKDVIPLCKAQGIKVFTYGGLLGGFLSDAWLNQRPPELGALPNRSLVKYRLIIDDWGGWDRYQLLLRQMRRIALAHDASIAQVAVSALLGRQRNDAVIVGISPSRYRQQNAELARLVNLNSDELEQLWAWDCPLSGGVYELERSNARHAGIMKYNLNREGAAAAAAQSA
jgi:aryl-alcohol dehydrogenase-like predicted oxidoreductase